MCLHAWGGGLGISRLAGGARSVCLHAWNAGLGISRHAGGARSVCLHAYDSQMARFWWQSYRSADPGDLGSRAKTPARCDWVPALGFLFHTTYVNVVRRSPRLRRVWAVELNLSLSVDSPGAPLNVPTNARMRLGHPDSDACSSLGFRGPKTAQRGLQGVPREPQYPSQEGPKRAPRG